MPRGDSWRYYKLKTLDHWILTPEQWEERWERDKKLSQELAEDRKKYHGGDK